MKQKRLAPLKIDKENLVFYATYKHDSWWLVDVYRHGDVYYVWMHDSVEDQEPLGSFSHMPTWEETKWWYDHLGG